MGRLYFYLDSAWQWLAEKVFLRFEFDIDSDALREIAHRGEKIAFSLINGGFIEWLVISSWCRKHKLDAVLVSNRKRVLFFSKPAYFFSILFRKKDYSDLFLSDPHPARVLFCPNSERKQAFTPSPSEQLLAKLFLNLKKTDNARRVVFVPIVFTWRRYLRGEPRQAHEYLLGLNSSPNLLGKFVYLLLQRRDSVVRALPLFDTSKFESSELKDFPGDEEVTWLARSTRRRILVDISKEMRVMLGPQYLAPHLVKETIIRDAELQQVITQVSQDSGRDKKKLLQIAYNNLTEIVAKYSYRSVEILYVLLTWLFNSVFEGVVYSKDEIQKIKDVSKKSTVVYIPCHRSHFDYLVMPYVLFVNDIVTPHIAAGINLGFWPLGPILRSGGAFFIRRSFKGDDLYRACLKKYMEYLVRNRINFKFFIEGTRSRSGKMLPPAYGLLKSVLEQYSAGSAEDIALVPVSISYEEVPEEKTYSREIGGAKKEKESAGLLLKSRRVFKRRMGRVYLNFADPIMASETVNDKTDLKLLEVQKAAFRICKRISDITPITPKSLLTTVLLNHHSKQLPMDTLLDLSEQLSSYLSTVEAPLTNHEEDSTRHALEQGLKILKKKGVLLSEVDMVPRRFAADETKRSLLNYYKNSAIHYLVIPNIALLSLMKTSETTHSFEEEFFDYAFELRSLLKFEFFFNPSKEFKTDIDRCMKYFISEDWRSLDKKTAVQKLQNTVGDLRHLSVFTRGVAYFFESYRLTGETLKESLGGTIEKKALIQQITRRAAAASEEAELLFPESVSIISFANALEFYKNHKLVELERSEKGSVVSPIGEAAQFDAIIGKLDTWLQFAASDFAQPAPQPDENIPQTTAPKHQGTTPDTLDTPPDRS